MPVAKAKLEQELSSIKEELCKIKSRLDALEQPKKVPTGFGKEFTTALKNYLTMGEGKALIKAACR